MTDLFSRVGEIVDFAGKLKARMIALEKTRARVKCPNPDHGEATVYIWARLDRRNRHLHFGCEHSTCHMRMME